MHTIPTLLVDPHRLFREGLKQLLAGSRFKIDADVGTIADALDAAVIGARLVIFDPRSEETAALPRLPAAYPDAKLVVLTSGVSTVRLRQAVEARASAYLSKELDPVELLHSLERVMAGETLFPTALAAALPGPPLTRGRRPRGVQPTQSLTPRETEILRRLTNGDSNRRIADDLALPEAAVKAHLKTVLRKIKASNRTQAAIWAIHNGLDQANNRHAAM
jgi:two-component system, NarL family, nitrate/nitrite response regulator NarL